jgi:hypothetical protein
MPTTTDGWGRVHLDLRAWATPWLMGLVLVAACALCAWQDAGDLPAVDTRPVAEAGR